MAFHDCGNTTSGPGKMARWLKVMEEGIIRSRSRMAMVITAV